VIESDQNADWISPDQYDFVGLALAKNFATNNSRRAYSSSSSEFPEKSTRTTRGAFLLPKMHKGIIMEILCFSGSEDDFDTCVGWLCSKNAMIKNASSVLKLDLPCPFTYTNYTEDLKIMEETNADTQAEVTRQNRPSRTITSINTISDY